MEVVLKYDPLNPDEVKAAQRITGSEPTGGVMPELKAFHPEPNAVKHCVAPVSSDVAQEAAAVANALGQGLPIAMVVTPEPPLTSEESIAAVEAAVDPQDAPEFDARGLPWDERIHASSKATNADGSWRNKRGVDKDLLAAVEDELGLAPAVAPEPASLGDAPPAPVPAPPPPAPVEAAAPPPPPPAPAPATDEVVTFQECMTLFTQHKDRKDAKEFLKQYDFTGLPDLFKADNSVRVAFKAWVLS